MRGGGNPGAEPGLARLLPGWDGEALLWQRQLHLARWEREGGLSRGREAKRTFDPLRRLNPAAYGALFAEGTDREKE